MTAELTRTAASSSRMGRSILAVFLGFLVVVVLSIGTDAVLHATGVFPTLGQAMSDSLFMLATAYRVVYTVVGGYITARLAPRRPIKHAVILGLIGLVAAIAGAAATWNRLPALGPKWYPLALIVTSLPSTWLGARIHLAQVQTRSSGASA